MLRNAFVTGPTAEKSVASPGRMPGQRHGDGDQARFRGRGRRSSVPARRHGLLFRRYIASQGRPQTLAGQLFDRLACPFDFAGRFLRRPLRFGAFARCVIRVVFDGIDVLLQRPDPPPQVLHL